jgi:hypothetical protein
MIRRSLSVCPGAVALVVALGLSTFANAKPPDLPANETITVMPKAAPETEKPAETLYETLPTAVPTPTLYQLRPTARRTLVGSILLGLNPVLALLPTEKALDTPRDHPQRVADDDIFCDMPRHVVFECGSHWCCVTVEEIDWFKWLMARWTIRYSVPAPEQNEGYVQTIATGIDFAYQAANDPPASENETPSPSIKVLPMPPEKSDVTCPYLRQQMRDRHARQFADPQIGRDVLDNLERLKQADALIEKAEALARDGCITEAMECCVLAEDLCPGSPSADRAITLAFDLCFGFDKPAATTEEAEQNADGSQPEPGVAEAVGGLMKACRLLMDEGMHERAAELARQAYALDPERVMADPLIYKMHLLADSPAKPASGSSEDCEPFSCPYWPSIGKPIQGIVKEKKESKSGPATLLVPPMPPVDYEVVPALDRVLTESAKKTEPAGAQEASEEEGPSSLQELIETMMDGIDVHTDGARLSCEWSCGGNVYHLRYGRGCLAIWKTPDAAKTKP